MEITWHGQGCLRLAERGYPTVVTDPHDPDETGLALSGLEASLVTSSRLVDDPRSLLWPQVAGVSRTVSAPGEYEIGGVFITGAACPPSDEDRENVVYTITYGRTALCYLGELAGPLKQSQIEAIGPVTVLVIPVGIPGGLTPAMAAETVGLIEPAVVVPVHYDVPGLLVERLPLEGFLKEMGVSEPTSLEVLRVTDGAASEETQIIVLEPR